MKITKFTLIVLSICLSLIASASNIVFPWRATTAIVKSGESFEVWLQADAGLSLQSVSLKAAFNTLTPQFSIRTGSWVYDQTSENTFNTKIKIKVPANAPMERYDLVLQTSQGNITSPASVKIIKAYKSSYYILHLSDMHAFQRGYETSLSRLSMVSEIANIINPEMVFNTGDNLYRPNEERMATLYGGDVKQGLKGLNHFSAPTFTVAGNHDIDFDNMPEEGFYKEKAAWWNKWWGLQTYQVKYGNARFLAINNGWHGFKPILQFNEISNWLKKEGSGNMRVGLAHIRNNEMSAFDSVANLGLVLVGHNHHIANQNPSLLNDKAVQYIANSMRDNMEFNLFRVDDKTGVVTSVGGATAQVVYVENPDDIKMPALYKPKLSLTFFNANDGTSTKNTATVINKFNFAIEGARVRFVMPLGSKYVISNGQVEQAFDGHKVHVVDVLVNLPALSNTVVEIIEL